MMSLIKYILLYIIYIIYIIKNHIIEKMYRKNIEKVFYFLESVV